jgi:hypothetical protein
LIGAPRRRGRRASCALALAALLLPAVPSGSVAADVAPLTDPVVIGEIPDQDFYFYSPDVVALPGQFVVAWGVGFARYQGSEIRDRGSAIDGRKVGTDGQPIGGVLPLVPVQRFTTKGAPRVGANASGSFVVTWASASEDTSEITQNLRRFAPDGTAGARVLLDHFRGLDPTGSVSAVALDAAGRSFAVWTRPRSPGTGLLGQLFLPSGRRLTDRFWATLRSASQVVPDLAMDGRGQAVLAYNNIGPHGTLSVFLQLYDAAGRLRTGDVPLSPPSPPVRQINPALAVNRGGSLVVAWQEGFQIWVRRFDSALRPMGPPIRVNAAGQPAGFPDVALDAQDRFFVTWLETDLQGRNLRVLGRGFAAAGAPLGPALRIDGDQGEGGEFYSSARPTVAAGDGGTFLVAWIDTTFGANQVLSRLYGL